VLSGTDVGGQGHLTDIERLLSDHRSESVDQDRPLLEIKLEPVWFYLSALDFLVSALAPRDSFKTHPDHPFYFYISSSCTPLAQI
jgi:hypothetical protein